MGTGSARLTNGLGSVDSKIVFSTHGFTNAGDQPLRHHDQIARHYGRLNRNLLMPEILILDSNV